MVLSYFKISLWIEDNKFEKKIIYNRLFNLKKIVEGSWFYNFAVNMEIIIEIKNNTLPLNRISDKSLFINATPP